MSMEDMPLTKVDKDRARCCADNDKMVEEKNIRLSRRIAVNYGQTK